MIRALLVAALFTAGCALLAACGQKGPLKLPEPAPASPAPAAP